MVSPQASPALPLLLLGRGLLLFESTGSVLGVSSLACHPKPKQNTDLVPKTLRIPKAVCQVV